MRLLHIGKYYQPFHGGIESFMADLLSTQRREGHEVYCLAHNHKIGLKLEHDRIEGVEVYRSPILGRLLFTPIAPFFYLHLRRLIKTAKPDVIHVHMPNVSAFWLLLLAKRADIPIVIHWHSDVLGAANHLLLSIAYKFYRPFESALLNLAVQVFATSPPYAKSSPALQKVIEKVRVVPLGIKNHQLAQQPKSESSELNDKVLNLLCIGRLTFYKGQDLLVRALKDIESVRLVLVGIGENKAMLEALVDELGVSDKVRFAGSVDSETLNSLVSESDCICLPSIERTEAFGVVLLEAMRAGKSTLVSDIPGSGTGWVVDHEITGLLVQPADVTGLQLALKRLKADSDAVLSMGQAGRSKFEAQFDINAVSQQISNCYLEIKEK